MQIVAPHLTTALRLRKRLNAAERRSSDAYAVLDQFDTGIILIDARMQIAFANKRAEAIAAAQNGLTLSKAGIAAAVPAETQALRQAIAAAIGFGTDAIAAEKFLRPMRMRLALSRPSGHPPLIVTVVPLHVTPDSPSVAAVFIVEPERPAEIDAHLLAAAFGLAPREAALAALLARGASLAEAAARLGIVIGTARWYLKRVLEKTNTHRQSELVRLVLSGFRDPGA
jgi:DNA-binding CsgD family transcriptional regulator